MTNETSDTLRHYERTQGWNEGTLLHLLGQFIDQRGLVDDLWDFLGDIVEEEEGARFMEEE